MTEASRWSAVSAMSPWTVNLTPADMSDSAGAQTILTAIRPRWPWLKHLFADAGYDRTKLMERTPFSTLSSKLSAGPTKAGCKVLPCCWWWREPSPG